MPQSMTTAPFLIHSPFTISAFPMPTTKMSALPTWTRKTEIYIRESSIDKRVALIQIKLSLVGITFMRVYRNKTIKD